MSTHQKLIKNYAMIMRGIRIYKLETLKKESFKAQAYK